MMLRNLKPESLEIRAKRMYDAMISGHSEDKEKITFDFDVFIDSFILLYEEYCTKGTQRNTCVDMFANKHKDGVTYLKSLKPSLKDFEVVRCIGKGHFGKVHIVNDKFSGKSYAMKTLDKDKTIKEGPRACYMEERDIMGLTNSKWIVNLHYAFQDEKNLYFLMDYIPYGNLGDLLDYLENNIMDEESAKFYLAEMAAGINSLHEIGYIHRDIKPENVLINLDGHIKLADFGTAIRICDAHKKACGMVGTPEYMAPEIFNPSKPTTISIDYWSLGVTAYVLFNADFPFSGDTQLDMIKNITDFETSFHFLEEFPVSDLAKDLITSLIAKEEKRLSFENLKKHPFFQGINWDHLEDTTAPVLPEEVKEPPVISEDDARSRANLYVTRRSLNYDIGFIGFSYSRPFFEMVKDISSQSIAKLANPQMSNDTSISDDTMKLHLAEISKLNSSISDLTVKNEEFKIVCQEKSVKLSKAEDYLNSLKSELISAKSRITELAVQLEHNVQEQNSLKSSLEKYNNCFRSIGVESLEKFIPQYMQISEDLKIMTREKEMYLEKSKKLMAEIEELNVDVGNYKKNLTGSQLELKNVNQDLKEWLEKAEEKLETTIKEYSSKLSVQESKLKSALTKMSDIEAELQLERIKNDSLRSQLKDLTKIGDLKGNLDSAQKSIIDLSSEKAQLDAKLLGNHELVKKLKEELAETNKKYMESESIVSSHQETIKVLQGSVDKLRFSFNNLNKDMKGMVSQHDHLSMINEELESQLSQSRKAYSKLKMEYEQCTSVKRWEESDVEQLKKVFNSQIDSLKSEIDQANIQIKHFSENQMEDKKEKAALINNMKDIEEIANTKTALLEETESKLKEKSELCLQLKSELSLQKEVYEYAYNSKVTELQRRNEGLYKTAELMKLYMLQDDKLKLFVQNLNLESWGACSNSTPTKNSTCSVSELSSPQPSIPIVIDKHLACSDSKENKNAIQPTFSSHSSDFLAPKPKIRVSTENFKTKFTVRKTKESIRKNPEAVLINKSIMEYPTSVDVPDYRREDVSLVDSPQLAGHSFTPEITVRPGSCPSCFNALPWGTKIVRCSKCKVSCHVTCADFVPYNCFKVKKPLLTNQLSPLSPIYLRTPSLASYIYYLVRTNEEKPENIWKRCWLTWNAGNISIYENEDSSISKEGQPVIPLFRCSLNANFIIHPSFNTQLINYNGIENLSLAFCIEYCDENNISFEKHLSESSGSSSNLSSCNETASTKRLFLKAENYENKRDWILTCMKQEQATMDTCKILPDLPISVKLSSVDALDIVSICILTPEILLLGCNEGVYVGELSPPETKLTPMLTELHVRQILMMETFLFVILDNSPRIMYMDLKSLLVDRKLISKRLTKSSIKDKFTTLAVDDNILMMICAQTRTAHVVVACSMNRIYILSPNESEFQIHKIINISDLITCMYFDEKLQKILFISDKVYYVAVEASSIEEFSPYINNNSVKQTLLSPLHCNYISRLKVPHQENLIVVCFKDNLYLIDDSGNSIDGFDPIQLPATPLQIMCRAQFVFVSFSNFFQIYNFESATNSQTITCTKYLVHSHRLFGVGPDPSSVYISICHTSNLSLHILDGHMVTKMDLHISLNKNACVEKSDPLVGSMKENKRSSIKHMLKNIIKK